jgi:hypothetical protein
MGVYMCIYMLYIYTHVYMCMYTLYVKTDNAFYTGLRFQCRYNPKLLLVHTALTLLETAAAAGWIILSLVLPKN